MTTAPAITGSLEKFADRPNLVLTRAFTASATDIWKELTESALLERWIGRWDGDPASGSVQFAMTAEDPDAEATAFAIHECDKPHRFAGETAADAGGWYLWFELTEADGTTTLRFGHRLTPTDDVGSIGPGWEYYLDRLTVARDGGDVNAVAWDTYFPAMQPAYELLVAAD